MTWDFQYFSSQRNGPNPPANRFRWCEVSYEPLPKALLDVLFHSRGLFDGYKVDVGCRESGPYQQVDIWYGGSSVALWLLKTSVQMMALCGNILYSLFFQTFYGGGPTLELEIICPNTWVNSYRHCLDQIIFGMSGMFFGWFLDGRMSGWDNNKFLIVSEWTGSPYCQWLGFKQNSFWA